MRTRSGGSGSGKGSKGSSRARREDDGDMATVADGSGLADEFAVDDIGDEDDEDDVIDEDRDNGESDGGSRFGSPLANPSAGSSIPVGAENLKDLPDGVTIASVVGLKSVVPA